MTTRLSEYTWYMAGDATPLSEMENVEMMINRYQIIETRYGEACIMNVDSDGENFNVITSSSRVIRALHTVKEFPVLATFVKVDGKWNIQ